MDHLIEKGTIQCLNMGEISKYLANSIAYILRFLIPHMEPMLYGNKLELTVKLISSYVFVDDQKMCYCFIKLRC